MNNIWDEISNFSYLKPYCEVGKHISERKEQHIVFDIAHIPLHESVSSVILTQLLIVNPEVC